MASGRPLDDADRQPWLETLAKNLSTWQNDGGAVLACSALQEPYRATLTSQCVEGVEWIILHASEAVLADRLARRKDHFFDKTLLRSQLEAFEMPDYGWRFNVESPPQDIVNSILTRLRSE